MTTSSDRRADVRERRARLLATFTQTWARPPEGAVRGDLDALVDAGSLERRVRPEWDKQTGYATSFFGGAGVMKRRRAYYRKPTEES